MQDENILRDICVAVVVVVALMMLGGLIAFTALTFMPSFWRLLL
jgi:hypothetical protein